MKKTRFNKKAFLVLFLLFAGFGLKAQIIPSLYTGIGTYTNLGGQVGIGTEVTWNRKVSACVAVGYSNMNFDMDGHIGAHPHRGFDFGLKYYIYKGLFAGVNYGLLDKTYTETETEGVYQVDNINAFKFTVGYRQEFYGILYAMPYIGLTSEDTLEKIKTKGWHPNLGLLLGISFDLP